MIYDIPGDEFIYEGVTYRVGAEVVATEGKYSLQGTTQGRYLTGGVPPIRFSM